MPQTLTLKDTRNLAGSFIHLQWKHEVFNRKNISILSGIFSTLAQLFPDRLQEERNSVVTAGSCRMLKSFCPRPGALSPHPEQLGPPRHYSAFSMWSRSYPLGLAADFSLSVEMSPNWRHSLQGLISLPASERARWCCRKAVDDDTTATFTPEFSPS